MTIAQVSVTAPPGQGCPGSLPAASPGEQGRPLLPAVSARNCFHPPRPQWQWQDRTQNRGLLGPWTDIKPPQQGKATLLPKDQAFWILER